MASQAGFVVENKFIQGLITESTALNFPQDACTDTLNCVFNEFGNVTRRSGLDLETGGALNSYTRSTGDVYQDYTWYTSAATSNAAFLVQQRGSTLQFFDITSSTTPSANPFTTVNLDSYRPSGSTLSTAGIACQFATGNGDLLVSNQNANPIYITYNDSLGTITTTSISLKYRDTVGLDDGLAVNFRPTDTFPAHKTNNPNHYYNLLNQGWGANNSDALGQWDGAKTTLPSNADAIAYFRTVKTDSITETAIDSSDPGNSPAPKGHFILGVGEDDRVAAAAADGYSGFTPTGTTGTGSAISGSVGTIIGDFSARTSNAFDSTTHQRDTSSAQGSGTSAYIGKNLTSISGSKISGCVVYPSWDSGFLASTGTTLTIELYGKATVPANATDGTLLGTTGSFSDKTSSVFIASSNTSTVYSYVWVRIRRTSGASDTYYIAELSFLAPGTSYVRPRCVSFFAGRAFYAGVDGSSTGANVYFSQVVVDKSYYGLCYQRNDPTSENFADLLATDGGYVKIPEMGKVQRLFPFQNSLLVFANNGVWQISGNGSDGFAATGYRVRRLTNIGMTSPNSVVDVKGVPMWWAEDGIYTINYDPNYDSSAVKSLTEETIKTFVLNVPAANRPYIRATFDRLNNYVYFGFLSTQYTDADNAQCFDTLLVFNAKTSAFFPWVLDAATANVPLFCGLQFVVDGNRLLGGVVKLATQLVVSGTRYLTYSEFNDSTNYKDYTQHMANFSAAAIDYSSYVIAGYRIDGQAMRNFQSKYVWTFMNDLSTSSLFLQGIWDFTNNASSGKWSTPQQAYNSSTTKGRTYDDIRISRRVVRGTGKALQVKYYSESGKPFSLIGWGIFEEGNDAT